MKEEHVCRIACAKGCALQCCSFLKKELQCDLVLKDDHLKGLMPELLQQKPGMYKMIYCPKLIKVTNVCVHHLLVPWQTHAPVTVCTVTACIVR